MSHILNIILGAVVLVGVMAVFWVIYSAYVRYNKGKIPKLSCGGCAGKDFCDKRSLDADSACQAGANRYKAVIFDLDGTLLDTAGDLNAAVNAALRQEGFPEKTLDQTRADIGNGTKVLIHKSVPKGTKEETEKRVFERFQAYYIKHWAKLTNAYPGIRGTLAMLSGRGLKLAVISNKQNALAQMLMTRFFGDRFAAVRGQDGTLARKPAPDMFFDCLKKLGLTAKDVLYVGDTEVDAEFARGAGADALLVSWGYRDKAFLLKQDALGVIDLPAQIVDYI